MSEQKTDLAQVTLTIEPNDEFELSYQLAAYESFEDQICNSIAQLIGKTLGTQDELVGCKLKVESENYKRRIPVVAKKPRKPRTTKPVTQGDEAKQGDAKAAAAAAKAASAGKK